MCNSAQTKPRPLTSFLTPIAAALAVACVAQAVAADGIVAVKQNGRTVYVNDEAPAKARLAVAQVPAAPVSRLMYWSHAEHAWKPVPVPNQTAMRAARSAAAEVRQYVIAQPRIGIPRMSLVTDPNYRTLARGYDVSAGDIDTAIEQAAERHNVDANLVRAIVKVESNYNNRAISRTGAMGLMQLMPQTARQLSVTNPFDPQQNIDAGVRHFRALLDSYRGDVKLSLAAYNAGEGAVARSKGIPPFGETRAYVKKITDLYMGNGGKGLFTPSAAPVRMIRTPDGVVKLTNTE